MAKAETVSAEADRRADDQDAAVEAAFVAGVLPEEDRRQSDVAPAVLDVGEIIAGDGLPDGGFERMAVCAIIEGETLDALKAASVGSIFEKTAIGWNVKYVDGGTVIHVQGPTIPEAIGSHGAQVEHPKTREQLAREVVAE